VNSDIEALARRAVACKGWRWVPGMLGADAYGVCGHVVDITTPLGFFPGAWLANHSGVAWLSAGEMSRCLPDLSDPCTLGGLLALVREALGDVWLPTCIDAEDEAWVVDSPSRNRQTRHESYAAALVAALEVTP